MKASVFNTTIYQQIRVGKIILRKNTIQQQNKSTTNLHILQTPSRSVKCRLQTGGKTQSEGEIFIYSLHVTLTGLLVYIYIYIYSKIK